MKSDPSVIPLSSSAAFSAEAFRAFFHALEQPAALCDAELRLLASNPAFEMVPGFFARYRTKVPATVQMLDYLDFEAKLRATAGDDARRRGAVSGLDHTWTELRDEVVARGGTSAARSFDAHVRRLRALHAGPAAVREAQHGLDLVDRIEDVYRS
jgi:hypothetical protein